MHPLYVRCVQNLAISRRFPARSLHGRCPISKTRLSNNKLRFRDEEFASHTISLLLDRVFEQNIASYWGKIYFGIKIFQVIIILAAPENTYLGTNWIL